MISYEECTLDCLIIATEISAFHVGDECFALKLEGMLIIVTQSFYLKGILWIPWLCP